MRMNSFRSRMGVVILLLLCNSLAISDERVDKLKETAARMVQEGRWSEAVDAYKGLTEKEPDDPQRLSRVTWTLLPDGKVHHVIKHSTDDGKTWSVALDGLYHKSDRDGEQGGV